jgi:hypothetical protein
VRRGVNGGVLSPDLALVVYANSIQHFALPRRNLSGLTQSARNPSTMRSKRLAYWTSLAKSKIIDYSN